MLRESRLSSLAGRSNPARPVIASPAVDRCSRWVGRWYPPAVPRPHGFDYVLRGDDVVISHHGRVASTLRGPRARAFLDEVNDQDPQELMARLTGNYRRVTNARPATTRATAVTEEAAVIQSASSSPCGQWSRTP